MKRLKDMSKLVLIIIMLFILSPSISYAHPGRTASDGCHYCRTNCDRWGVPWNERHCHGGSSYKSTTAVECDNNLWTFLALGKQSCKYGFWNFAKGWGLIYGIGGFAIYSYVKSKRE